MDYSESITLLEYRLAQLEQFIIPAILPPRVREEIITLPTEPVRHQVRWVDESISFDVTSTEDDPNRARVRNRRMYSEARDRIITDLSQAGAPPQE